MRVRIPQRPKFMRRYEWHRWFAWYPVVCEGKIVWMEMIERYVEGCEAGTLVDHRFPLNGGAK